MLSTAATSACSRDLRSQAATRLEKLANSLGIKRSRPASKRVVTPISPPLNREYEFLRTSEMTDTAYVSLEAAQKDRTITHRSLELLDIEPIGPSIDTTPYCCGKVRLITLDEARRTAHIVRRPVEML